MSGLRSVSVEEYVATLPVDEQEVAHHVLLGGFNKRGDPVGFHHAPNGVAPPGRRIDHVVRRFSDGTYQARVSIWDDRRGWVAKAGMHTMFPDLWTSQQVLKAGREAYRRRVDKVVLRWRSQYGDIKIAGYRRTTGSGPATFFPDPKM